ncbi:MULTISPECIES: hypothetical protein [Bradyrhizobium]|uniref:Uncharacterized protein n=1 Tax=Bradyrhizobium elkanii TaxID=29448 RepID=A0A8I1Y701_BRAEL|nr:MULTISPECIES: hypothetical protein [Bradyrhizobium]MBP1294422.1 hypothetical protein [Bradyrhizobium elkanii]MCA1401102.1 hypothetical protein [Bradyrhizobium sp. BRP56]MCP1925190.1 hypothetical protein [Bradyrhizobium elkanii]MCS3477321.1 hypothetical protein [Bradyrhizobium elkanii]MCS3584056.1 hypothetical protein [Bradyrhizobium elkanii]
MAQELLKLGPAGLICVILVYSLCKSEQREAKKDIRIQLLENQLTESYGERVLAADRLAEAIHSTRTAFEALTSKIRAKR